MNEFPILLREGVFAIDDDRHLCLIMQGGEVIRVDDLLAPFENKRVRLAAHHLPSTPINPSLWGGGSCMWQGIGVCAAGHAVRPTWLYNVSAEGVLVKLRADVWALEQPDGTTMGLNLMRNLPGHQGRIACAPLLAVEEMRDALGASASMVDGLGAHAADLRDLMERLKSIVEGR